MDEILRRYEDQAFAEQLCRRIVRRFTPEEHPHLARMLLICCRREQGNRPSPIKVFYLYFLRVYADQGYYAKVVIANAFFDAYDIIMEHHRANRATAFNFDELVDLSVKHTKERKEKKPSLEPLNEIAAPHAYLMGRSLGILYDNFAHRYFNSFARLLALLDLSGLVPEMAKACDWDAQFEIIIDKFGSDTSTAKQFLRAAQRHLKARFRVKRSVKGKRDGTPSRALGRPGPSSMNLATIEEEQETDQGSRQDSEQSDDVEETAV
uniref:MIF4G domain-containing protein n=1 Tax=Steinernema glaseri TaxID=37863 RepID=A0A1I8A8A4_9BILA